MLQANDPFELYKAKKKIERLEKKFKSSGGIKCPIEEKGGTPGADDSRTVLFDPKRAWIY
jgi:hypothetical protein